MMHRSILLSVLLATANFASANAIAEEVKPATEREFFFAQCKSALEAQARSRGKKLDQAGLGKSIEKYCDCTSQVVVKHLTTEEMIAFADNPEAEPASSKIKPFFMQCRGK